MYRWVDHTAEVQLEVHAPTEHEVLLDALRALAELLGFAATPCAGAPSPGKGSRAPGARELAQRTISVQGADRPALLAGWLEELVFLAESEGFVATGATALELAGDRLQAIVTGLLDEPPPLVKAVTYHRLLFEPRDGGYVARVVLDV